MKPVEPPYNESSANPDADHIPHQWAPPAKEDKAVPADRTPKPNPKSAFGNLKSSQDRKPQIRNHQCTYLACAGGLGGAAVCSLYWRGWSITGHQLDLLPCLTTALAISFLVQLAGRLNPRATAVLSALFALLAVTVGKLLAWDLFGLLARWTNDSLVGSSWIDRLDRAWQQLPLGIQQANLVCYAATPLFAALAMPMARIARGLSIARATAV